jgi:CDP-glycerol glycerophosphotransferase (TagB/SpsB family)
MRVILFCINPYAFEILYPLYLEGTRRKYEILWYVPEKILHAFKQRDNVEHTHLINNLIKFRADVIFVPGNEVPHFLRGVKTQIFHGLAGEKKGHFRIRHYFDLYLTQGPYFTERFLTLSEKYKNFDVVETGWSKLDVLFQERSDLKKDKEEILRQTGSEHIVLYAPTFSPSLTSANLLISQISTLVNSRDIYLKIKFHDLMDPAIVHRYNSEFEGYDNVQILKNADIIDQLIMSDIMISDTSSVVYEFILLNKPVITFRSRSANINWLDIDNTEELIIGFDSTLSKDAFRERREMIIQSYHPYRDGKSSDRMYKAVEEYIATKGIPEKRKLSAYRRYKINSYFR